jgi:hypothetical protein
MFEENRTPEEAVRIDQLPHNRRDTELLYRIYMEKRLQSQISFYESRIRENQLNADFTFTLGAAVMTLSSLVATISASGTSPALSFLAVILPAAAALLASFRQLYGWERQINLYRDALMGLERVKLLAPDNDRMPFSDLMEIYPRLVQSGEKVFTAEVNQWGQFVQATEKDTEPSTDARALDALTANLQLTNEQLATIRTILAAGTPRATFSPTTETNTVVLPRSSASTPDKSELLDFDDVAAAQPAVPAAPLDVAPPVEMTAPPVEESVQAVALDAPPLPESEDVLTPGASFVAPPPNDDETSAG